MHVLIAANNVFPDPEAGGSGRYIHETGRRMVKRGHKVTVITRRRGNTTSRDSIAGMEVYRYDESVKSLWHTARNVRSWCQETHEQSPIDILNFHGPLSSTLVDRSLPTTIPRIYTFHGPWPAEYRERNKEKATVLRNVGTRVRHALEFHVLGHSDRTITLSDFMRSQLEEWYHDVPPGPIIPGGVDINRFHPDATAEISLGDEDVSFLTVRRLTPRMGIENLIDSFTNVQERYPDSHLYIAGDGPLRPALKRRTKENGVNSNVTFLGYVEESSLPGLYANADLFVLPTTALEGFGLVTLEALASETPVIGTAVGGTPEILEPLDEQLTGSPPLLLDENNQLADRLLSWANCTRQEKNDAGKEARKYVCRSYTWEQTVDRVISEFNPLAKNHK